MTEFVKTGRCAHVLAAHRNSDQGSGGGIDLRTFKAKGYRPSLAISTGSLGAVSPPLSG